MVEQQIPVLVFSHWTGMSCLEWWDGMVDRYMYGLSNLVLCPLTWKSWTVYIYMYGTIGIMLVV